MNLEDLQFSLPKLCLTAAVPEYEPAIQAYFRYYGLDIEQRLAGLEHYFGSIDSEPYTVACHYYKLPTAQDGEAKRKTLLIVHGYYDHAGLYQHPIMNALQQGYNVLCFDLPGHGLSSGERTYIERFSDYQRVLKTLLSTCKAAGISVDFLMGQSTGAAIIMQYLLQHPHQVFKAVLLAPLFKPCNWRWSIFWYDIAKHFLTRVPRSFAKNSSDKQFIQFVKFDDPLQARSTHLAWVGALQAWIEDFKYCKSSRHSVLVVQGTNDTTVDWQDNIPAIEKKFPEANVEYLEGAGHQLVNESEPLRKSLFTLINNYLSS